MNVQTLAARGLREVYRREVMPARLRWWQAAAGLRDWYRLVARELGERTEIDGRALMRELVAETWRRRYADCARRSWWWLPVDAGPDERALWAAALYRMRPNAKGLWLWGDTAPGGIDWLRGAAMIRRATAEQRWRELTVHLGEWLIVLTDTLPERLPRAHKLLGDICFAAGVAYAESVASLYGLETGSIDPAAAIEVLRVSEYLFRVNPGHWAGADDERGFIEGTACPWYTRPGWDRMHCGIFGQFQSGIASVFGLRYTLTKTIPKHGSRTCRIDLTPIPLGRRS